MKKNLKRRIKSAAMVGEIEFGFLENLKLIINQYSQRLYVQVRNFRFVMSLSVLILLFGIQACNTPKEGINPPNNKVISYSTKSLKVSDASNWFNKFITAYKPVNQNYVRKLPSWEKAWTSSMSHDRELIVVPIEHHLNTEPANFNTYLWIFRGADNELTYKVIEYLSTSQNVGDFLDLTYFSGAMVVKDWEGNTLNGFVFENGKSVGVLEKLNGKETLLAKNIRTGKIDVTICENVEITKSTCTSYYYKVCVPHLGTCTEWNPNGTFCANYSVIVPQCYWAPDFPGQPNPNAGGTQIGASEYVVSPGSSLKSVHQNAEWNCFNKAQAATLTIYIDQPNPGNRIPYKRSGAFVDVGHTFISIKQGQTIRIVGFYPTQTIVTPLNPTSGGGLYDDSGHAYDVKMDISLSGPQLNNVLNKLVSTPTSYNLNSYNCTNFGVEVAKAAGVDLPATVGNWPGGAGLNPGDFGEDVRLNVPGMVYRSSGNAPQKSGSCM